MNRRSKLNLSPEEEVHKQQPSGFQKRAHNGSANSKERRGPQASSNAEVKSEAKGLAGDADMFVMPAGRQLLKAALVVAASGLALYLLKRRFF
ncbi:MAG: hypothetical protein ABFR65_00760 [Pseudomonadota bacterium]